MSNSVDIFISGIFFVSILLGLYRGFLKEAISLGTWVASIYVSIKFSAPLAAYFAGSAGLSSGGGMDEGVGTVVLSKFALSASFLGLFIATKVAGSLVGYILTRTAESGGLTIPNRILGGGFGALRGYLFAVLLLFICQFTSLSQQPAFASSSLRAALQSSVNGLDEFVRPQVESIKIKSAGVAQSVGDRFKEMSG